jgi:hypothetical protein
VKAKRYSELGVWGLAACKECLPKLKEYKGKNKELRKRYGISVEDYNKMFSDQKGSCANM